MIGRNIEVEKFCYHFTRLRLWKDSIPDSIVPKAMLLEWSRNIFYFCFPQPGTVQTCVDKGDDGGQKGGGKSGSHSFELIVGGMPPDAPSLYCVIIKTNAWYYR